MVPFRCVADGFSTDLQDCGSGSSDESIANEKFDTMRQQRESMYAALAVGAMRDVLAEHELDSEEQKKEDERLKAASRRRKMKRKKEGGHSEGRAKRKAPRHMLAAADTDDGTDEEDDDDESAEAKRPPKKVRMARDLATGGIMRPVFRTLSPSNKHCARCCFEVLV